LIVALHAISIFSVPADPPAVETRPKPSWLAIGLCLALALSLFVFGILAAIYMLFAYPHLSSSRFMFIPEFLAGWSVVASSFYSFYRLAGYPCYIRLRTLIPVVALFLLFLLLRFMDFVLGFFDGRAVLH